MRCRTVRLGRRYTESLWPFKHSCWHNLCAEDGHLQLTVLLYSPDLDKELSRKTPLEFVKRRDSDWLHIRILS